MWSILSALLRQPSCPPDIALGKGQEPGRGGPGWNGGSDGGDCGGAARTGREIRVPLWTWGLVDVVASLHVATPLGQSADDELLSQAGANPFCGTDHEIPKDKANAAIRPGKIEIREAGCRQVTAEAGVIWLCFSAVTPGDKWAEHRMPNSRAGCAGSLIEVAGVLMQQ